MEKLKILNNDERSFFTPHISFNGMPEWVYITATVIAVLLMLFSPIAGGQTGLRVQAISVFALMVFALIISYMLEDAFEKKWLFSVTMIGASGYFLMYIFALIGFPGFLRSIQGKYFIYIWLGYIVVVYLTAIIVLWKYTNRLFDNELERLKNKNYSHNDLMIISGYSRHKVVGYYITKAKADNILRLTYIEAGDGNRESLLVNINESIPETYLKKYCKDNPQVGLIVEYLKEQKAFGRERTSVEQVISNVKPQMNLRSKGSYAMAETLLQLEKIRNIIFCIAICLVYYVGITKLNMGMANEKAIAYLAFIGFPISYVALWGFNLFCGMFIKEMFEEKILSKIFEMNSCRLDDFNRTLQNVLAGTGDLTSEQVDDLFKCYITNGDAIHANWTRDLGSGNEYAYALLLGITQAERSAAVAAASAAADRGNSANVTYFHGCSGCGGGGGGCGGCGN